MSANMTVTFIGRKIGSSGEMCILSHDVPNGISMGKVRGILYNRYQDVLYVRYCTPAEYQKQLTKEFGNYFVEVTLRYVIR
jgi:hypothetical protein